MLEHKDSSRLLGKQDNGCKMQHGQTMVTNHSDSEDDEQLLVVGVISSPESSGKSKKMKADSPQKMASLPTENMVKRVQKKGFKRKLGCKPHKRTAFHQGPFLNSDSDLDDEMIVVGQTSTGETKTEDATDGDRESHGRKRVTCRKLRDEALHEQNLEEVFLHNADRTGLHAGLPSERTETEQETSSVKLGKSDCSSNKEFTCLGLPSDIDLTQNVGSVSKNCGVKQSVSHGVKKTSKLERIPLKSKNRQQHRKTDSRRKRKSEEGLPQAVNSSDVVDRAKVSEEELWFENMQEKEETETSSTTENLADVNEHLETNNNDKESKDDETLGVRQLSPSAEMDSDDELIDPSLEIDEEDFSEGDLVWAQHPRNPFWPAVVKEITEGRQKKITIEYFNRADVYRCQYSVRAIRPFIHYRKKMLHAGNHSEQAESFRVAVQEAMDYLKERALGKDIPLTTPVKEALSDQQSIHCQSLDSPPLTPPECHSTPMCPGTTCSTPSDGQHSPPSPKVRIGLARLFSNDDVGEERIAKDQEKIKLKKKWDTIEDKLMKIILKDETKERLLGIWKGKVKSERHNIFFSSSIKERDNLKYYAHLGALKTDEKIDKITNYLNEIWRHNCQQNESDLPNSSYIFEVWLPEAILFAVMKSRRIGVKKAEKVIISEGRQVVKELEME